VGVRFGGGIVMPPCAWRFFCFGGRDGPGRVVAGVSQGAGPYKTFEPFVGKGRE